MNIGELTEICKKLRACPDGIRWLETFDESDSIVVALNALRLYNRDWLYWFIMHDPVIMQSYLKRLRQDCNEYSGDIYDSTRLMIDDTKSIMDASPVNLDLWEKRVAQYEAENAESWKDFKFKIAYDFEKWADYLYYYLKGR